MDDHPERCTTTGATFVPAKGASRASPAFGRESWLAAFNLRSLLVRLLPKGRPGGVRDPACAAAMDLCELIRSVSICGFEGYLSEPR